MPFAIQTLHSNGGVLTSHLLIYPTNKWCRHSQSLDCGASIEIRIEASEDKFTNQTLSSTMVDTAEAAFGILRVPATEGVQAQLWPASMRHG